MTGWCRHGNACAQNGFLQGNGHLNRERITLGKEAWVWCNLQLYEGIAVSTRTSALCALASKAERLPLGDARWNVHIQGASIAQDHALGASLDGARQADFEVIAEVLATAVCAGIRRAAEELGERIAGFGKIRVATKAAVAIAGIGLGIVAVVLAARALRSRFVDRPLVKQRPLLRVDEQPVSIGDILELFFRGLVAWVQVGMQLPGQPPVRLLDLIRRGVTGNTKCFVWTAHSNLHSFLSFEEFNALGRSSAASGIHSSTTVPAGPVLATERFPLCRDANIWLIERPSPVP
ncbi:hypothetical protein D3C73_1063050 [compost metagenome]